MPAPVLSHYRALCRRVARLPLDSHSLAVLRANIRHQFSSAGAVDSRAFVDRRLYDRACSAMDDILVDEKYKQLPRLLDLVHKHSTAPWVQDFNHTKYNAFKRSWPQVHVIDDFADAQAKTAYDLELERSEPISHFSLSAEFAPDTSFPPLAPLPRSSAAGRNPRSLQSKAREFYDFLSANWSRLSDLKLHSFEVFYLPNRYGLPESVQIREGKLRAKVNYIKDLFATYKPLDYASMHALVDFVASDAAVNPNFFRHMLRKHAKEDPEQTYLVRKHVRHKQLVPDERNIKFHYRQYVVRQFALHDGKYVMSPMRNMYD